MSDEINQEVSAAIELLNTPEVQEVREESPEDVARSQGWRPKEEFDGEKSKWVPADEFLRRKPLFDKIHEQGKAIKDYAKTVEHMAETVKKIEERTRREEQEKYEKRIEEFKQMRKQAIREGDEDAVERIEAQIEKVRSSHPEVQKEEARQPAADPNESVINTWVERNKWYDADEDLRDFMNAKQQANLAKGMSIAEALQASEKQVRQAFAYKFENPNKGKPSPVIPKNPEPKGASMDMLTPEMKTAFRILQRSGMSLDEYISSQKAAGNL